MGPFGAVHNLSSRRRSQSHTIGRNPISHQITGPGETTGIGYNPIAQAMAEGEIERDQDEGGMQDYGGFSDLYSASGSREDGGDFCYKCSWSMVSIYYSAVHDCWTAHTIIVLQNCLGGCVCLVTDVFCSITEITRDGQLVGMAAGNTNIGMGGC